MYKRYVAIGDSSSEGLDDPDGAGGYRGWTDRLAEHLARVSPDFSYANLAVRGRLASQMRAEQLPRALELAPDLATVVGGVNDMLRPGFDPARVEDDLDAMIGALRATGATVLTFTVGDPVHVNRLAGRIRPRVVLLNEVIRRVAARHDALVTDFAAHSVSSDPRLWSTDRLHANSLGHERIAAAVAHTLGLPEADETWHHPLPERPLPHALAQLASDARWIGSFMVPWMLRRVRGRSSGDRINPKRPELSPVSALRD